MENPALIMDFPGGGLDSHLTSLSQIPITAIKERIAIIARIESYTVRGKGSGIIDGRELPVLILTELG